GGTTMSGPDPRVAVVVITHNRCEEVLRTLRHLTRLPEQPHVVLVDNGSTDGTSAQVVGHYPQVEGLNAGGHQGAAGRARGGRRLRPPFVALCDADTWGERGALSRAADLFAPHAHLGVLTARVLVAPEERDDPLCAELERSPLPAAPGMPGRSLLGFLAGAS